MGKTHQYAASIKWTGNTGSGTSAYTAYERSHTVSIKGKPTLDCSSDPSFRGDPTKYNPEDLLICSLSSCHMLWYLNLCASNSITVVKYEDEATGTMVQNEDGSGQFTEVVLHPKVIILEADKVELAKVLHHKANEFCFIARSCNFPVRHDVVVDVEF